MKQSKPDTTSAQPLLPAVAEENAEAWRQSIGLTHEHVTRGALTWNRVTR